VVNLPSPLPPLPPRADRSEGDLSSSVFFVAAVVAVAAAASVVDKAAHATASIACSAGGPVDIRVVDVINNAVPGLDLNLCITDKGAYVVIPMSERVTSFLLGPHLQARWN
jgi:hypothetical protein